MTNAPSLVERDRGMRGTCVVGNLAEEFVKGAPAQSGCKRKMVVLPASALISGRILSSLY